MKKCPALICSCKGDVERQKKALRALKESKK